MSRTFRSQSLWQSAFLFAAAAIVALQAGCAVSGGRTPDDAIEITLPGKVNWYFVGTGENGQRMKGEGLVESAAKD